MCNTKAHSKCSESVIIENKTINMDLMIAVNFINSKCGLLTFKWLTDETNIVTTNGNWNLKI